MICGRTLGVSFSGSDRLRLFDQHLGLFDRGDIDQASVKGDRPLPFLLRLLHSLQDPLRLDDLFLAGRKDFIGESDLARMYGPFAFAAEDCGTPRLDRKSTRLNSSDVT